MSTLTATPDLLWPANGQMVAVTIGASATDDTDPAPVCQISSVASSEDATSVDWVQTGPLSLLLRADRDGLGTGRTYTITVICTNAAQLSSSATTTVFVPHDRR
jgi:hypothetical protein